jgi:hypothetical protein
MKNPNKVAAGLKSAEARKAKQEDAEQKQIDVERRLAQLEELKSHMREPEQRSADSTEPPVQIVTKELTPTGVGTWSVLDWAPTALLCLGIGAIAWQALKPAPRPQSQSQIVPTPREIVSTPVGDPFNMA